MTDAADFVMFGKVFDDLLLIAARRREGVVLSVVPDLVRPLLVDNVNTVYVFVPKPTDERTSTDLMVELLRSDAVLSVHPAFDPDEGYQVFAASRVHGHRARNMLYALLVKLGYVHGDDKLAGDERGSTPTPTAGEYDPDPFSWPGAE